MIIVTRNFRDTKGNSYQKYQVLTIAEFADLTKDEQDNYCEIPYEEELT